MEKDKIIENLNSTVELLKDLVTKRCEEEGLFQDAVSGTAGLYLSAISMQIWDAKASTGFPGVPFDIFMGIFIYHQMEDMIKELGK